MSTPVEVFTADSSGNGLRIGIAQARFNAPVCEGLRKACVDTLIQLGVASDDIFVCTVPGALEIPTALDAMANTGEFDGLVALGAIIRGETYHFEVVSNESAAGVQKVGLDNNIPIANAILTTNTDEQALARIQEKGSDAAKVVVEMANLLSAIDSLGGQDGEDNA